MARGRRGLGTVAAAAVTWLAVGTAGAVDLRVGIPRLPASADPVTLLAPTDAMLARLVYQGLVGLGDRGEVEPSLASRWSVSRDGLTWTFHIRSDVVFHDGTPLSPAEVVTSLSRHVVPEEGPEGLAPDQQAVAAWAPLFRGPRRLVREIRTGEPGTVVITLAQPYAPLLAVLAHPAFGIALAPRDGGDRWQGTGLFRPVDREGDRLVLEVVRPVRTGVAVPRVDRIVAVKIADDAAGLGELGRDGGLDLLLAQAPPGWGGLGLQVVAGPTTRVGWLVLRTDQGPFSVQLVRQALALALDPGLLEPALGRWAVLHGSLLPPGLWAGRAGLPHRFDPGRARKLLAEAGALDSQVVLDVPDALAGPDLVRLAEAIRLSAAPAGLRVEVRVGGAGPAGPGSGPDTDLGLIEVQPSIADPHAFLGGLLSSDAAPPAGRTNVAHYRNPVADGMLMRASQLGFRPERLRLYQRLDRLVADEAPYLPLYARLSWLVARPSVRGLAVDPAGLHRLERVWLDGSPPR